MRQLGVSNVPKLRIIELKIYLIAVIMFGGGFFSFKIYLFQWHQQKCTFKYIQ